MAVKSFITLAPAQPLNGFQYLGSTDIRSQTWIPFPLGVGWGLGGGHSLKIVNCLNEKKKKTREYLLVDLESP
jgi:hypothetical protein